MSPSPKSVIHISFLPGDLIFDARPIWTALNEAVASGRIDASDSEHIQQELGESAIHIATRFQVMRLAVTELRVVSESLYSIAPKARPVPSIPNTYVLSDNTAEALRDHLLLAVDSFLFEFRAFLELMAKFAYGFLAGIGKRPTNRVKLSNGDTLVLVRKNGEVNTHNVLRYLCEILKVQTDWYSFLSVQRNFFTHAAAPYCAIEKHDEPVLRYEILVMRTNIHNFAEADPNDYFRVSNCNEVILGVRNLASAVQRHLIDSLL